MKPIFHNLQTPCFAALELFGNEHVRLAVIRSVNVADVPMVVVVQPDDSYDFVTGERRGHSLKLKYYGHNAFFAIELLSLEEARGLLEEHPTEDLLAQMLDSIGEETVLVALEPRPTFKMARHAALQERRRLAEAVQEPPAPPAPMPITIPLEDEF